MKKILLCILLFISLNIQSQNLVPNPSFETFIECPDTSFLGFYSFLDSTWFQFNSADYFNTCDTSNYYGVPDNFVGGYQFPVTGNAYCGFILYQTIGFDREYIEIELDSTLVNGTTYYVRFYVSLGDSMQYALENIGAMFTDTLFDPYPAPTFAWQTGIPQVKNPSGNMLNDKTNWMVIQDSFIAIGGEKFITIGNFDDDPSTIIQYQGGSGSSTDGAYYFIDDVYVGSIPPPVGISETEKKNYFRVYPNPNQGTMILECDIKEAKSGGLKIYDLTGKLAKEFELSFVTGINTIDLQELNTGMYIYEVSVNDKVAHRDKLIISK